MRTSVELSDDLFRRAKAAAAMRGRKFKDLVEEGLVRVLESPDMPHKKTRTKTLYELMKPFCGIGNSGISDLATNPKYMEGFGLD